jgi:thiol-disulfide isomerase/thioredoxin
MTMTRVRLLAAAVLLALPAAARAQESGLPLGSSAPSAVLQTLDGRSVDLAQLVGKGPAVVEFWATWCENCDHLLPTLQKVHAKYGNRVKFFGVSVNVNQSAKRVGLHVKKYKVPGVQLYDTKGLATGAWDVPATSHVVVIGRNGKVVYTGVGGTQDLDAAIRKAL